MKDFLHSITRSSADPRKMSLTIVGFITGAAAMAVKFAPIVCTVGIVCVNPDSIVPFSNDVIQVVDAVAIAVASGMTAIGLVRKMINGRWSHPGIV